jgi:hypothetical protein
LDEGRGVRKIRAVNAERGLFYYKMLGFSEIIRSALYELERGIQSARAPEPGLGSFFVSWTNLDLESLLLCTTGPWC